MELQVSNSKFILAEYINENEFFSCTSVKHMENKGTTI